MPDWDEKLDWTWLPQKKFWIPRRYKVARSGQGWNSECWILRWINAWICGVVGKWEGMSRKWTDRIYDRWSLISAIGGVWGASRGIRANCPVNLAQCLAGGLKEVGLTNNEQRPCEPSFLILIILQPTIIVALRIKHSGKPMRLKLISPNMKK